MSGPIIINGNDNEENQVSNAKFGKERFPSSYQDAVGINASEKLHTNSKELVEILKSNNVIENNISVFEIGAGGCRNIKYILDENSTIKLGANDLFKESSFKNMDIDVKNIIDFYECDTLELLENYELNPDLLISSDHLMHVEHIKVEKILNLINEKWNPKWILLREIKKEFENITHPRLYHNYDVLNSNYELISESDSKQDSAYFIKLYRRFE